MALLFYFPFQQEESRDDVDISPLPGLSYSGKKISIDPVLLEKDPVHFDQKTIWQQILHCGQQLMMEAKNRNGGKDVPALVAVEVGANILADAREMASFGFETHTFEPSPKAFEGMKTRYEKLKAQEPEIAKKVLIYNYAVGDTDGGEIFFDNSGSTGAAVVSEEEAAKSHTTNIVRVKTATLDSFFAGEVEPDVKMQPPSSGTGGKIFAAKIDVQGFEPKVFEGMRKSISERKVHFILTEHDPMALDEVNGFTEKCTEALNHIRMMHDAGYMIYALKLETHPKFEKAQKALGTKGIQRDRPFDDLEKDCLNMYQLQDKYYEEPDYKFHIWSDLLAVSPDAPWPENEDAPINW
eukprot:CAMPEP_0196805028 /NCGR_PEP_ID=MMETSP1362-20130617/4758_1 /TAXON_ID=163516 /ORGANISM="Leptocylindrus danicus, Strain CCMP1856" /LENGTH=352 /DNA_ID=CAMNT_0042177693 /DNA_START=264 /DNA_END=1319 /DNA_ORIENTATION=-